MKSTRVVFVALLSILFFASCSEKEEDVIIEREIIGEYKNWLIKTYQLGGVPKDDKFGKTNYKFQMGEEGKVDLYIDFKYAMELSNFKEVNGGLSFEILNQIVDDKLVAGRPEIQVNSAKYQGYYKRGDRRVFISQKLFDKDDKEIAYSITEVW